MIVLRDDQNDLIDRTRAAFARCRRVLAQAGCGWGKTTFASEIVRCALGRRTRTLVIAHRRRLIQQLSDRFAQFGIPHSVIMANMPDALHQRSDNSSPIIVASKDTLISRAKRDGLPIADLVIPDECHRLLGQGYTDLMNHYSGARWLGLTATPSDGERGLGNYFDEMVCAPPTSELIRAGVVVPYRVYAALELAELRKSGGRFKPAGDPVEQWLRHAAGRPTVLFAPRVAESKAVVESFNRAGITAVHIDAHSSEAERDDACAGLESGAVKLVSQVGLWIEGVDVPCLSVVQLLAKCGSLIKFIQATMRAGRGYPGKEYATLIDHSGAVFEFGFPDDDMEWSLAGGEPVKNKTKDGGTREPFVCVKCGMVYSGTNTCPACGCTLAANRKMYQPEMFEHLVEVGRDFAASTKSESNQRVWTSILFSSARRGAKCKAAAGQFHARTGLWPEQANVTPTASREDRDERVIDVFPQFGAKAKTRQEAGGLFA